MKAISTPAPKCPRCGQECPAKSGNMRVCFYCEVTFDPDKKYCTRIASKALPEAAPQLTPGETHVSEVALVRAIHSALTDRGWRVYRAGQWRSDKSGSDPGIPDLIAIYPASEPYPAIKVLLEVKNGKKGTVSPAQQILCDIGGSVIVRSVEDALLACGYAL